jgi:hypothetical protein
MRSASGDLQQQVAILSREVVFSVAAAPSSWNPQRRMGASLWRRLSEVDQVVRHLVVSVVLGAIIVALLSLSPMFLR